MNSVASQGLKEQLPSIMHHKEKGNFKVLSDLPNILHAAQVFNVLCSEIERNYSDFHSNDENSPISIKPKCEEINLLSNRQQKLFNCGTHTAEQVFPKLLLGRAGSAPAVVVAVPAWAAAGRGSHPHGTRVVDTWKMQGIHMEDTALMVLWF